VKSRDALPIENTEWGDEITVFPRPGKCPKVSNMISRELIWQEVRSEKTLDLQGFYGVT
jgi:hypothetical protein